MLTSSLGMPFPPSPAPGTPVDDLEAAPEVPETGPDSTAEDAAEIIQDYWAAKPGEELWPFLQDKIDYAYRAAQSRGLFAMARLAYSSYFGLTNTGVGTSAGQFGTQSLRFSGDDGEALEFTVANFRSFVDQIVGLVTKVPPSFQAIAQNDDYDSLAQVEASDSTVNSVYERDNGPRKEKATVLAEILYGKAYTHVFWDPDGGPEIEVPTTIPSSMGDIPGPPKKQHVGELNVEKRWWWDVVCEPYRSEDEPHMWRMIRQRRSTQEMIARFPAFATQIQESKGKTEEYTYGVPGVDPLMLENEDFSAVYTFYHAKCAAMPEGRKSTFVNGVWVEDDDLPIDEIPVYPLLSSEIHNTSFGASDLWNLIPFDQLEAQIMSDIATNIEAFGRPPLIIGEGVDIDLDALAAGERVFVVPPGAEIPQAVKFPAVPDDSYKILDLLKQGRQALSGLNAIARGDTSAHITSGAHAALYSSLAVDAQEPRTATMTRHREAVGNGILQHLKKFAEHPQLVAIVGEDERPFLQSFKREDLAGIQRVKVKARNPQMETQAGRLQVAEMLKGWPGNPLQDPQQIVELIVSGQFKPLYNPTRVSKLRIKAENEALLRAPQVQETQDIDPQTRMLVTNRTVPEVPIYPTDNAAAHVIEHTALLASPAAKDPAVLDAILTHILEHVKVARAGDPYLAQLLQNPPPETAPIMPTPPDQQDSSAAQNSTKNASKILDDGTDDSQGAGLPQPSQPAKPPAPPTN